MKFCHESLLKLDQTIWFGFISVIHFGHKLQCQTRTLQTNINIQQNRSRVVDSRNCEGNQFSERNRWLRLSLHHIIKSYDICDINPLYTHVTVWNIFTCAKSYSHCFNMWYVLPTQMCLYLLTPSYNKKGKM